MCIDVEQAPNEDATEPAVEQRTNTVGGHHAFPRKTHKTGHELRGRHPATGGGSQDGIAYANGFRN